jgi:hypothetical protein
MWRSDFLCWRKVRQTKGDRRSKTKDKDKNLDEVLISR